MGLADRLRERDRDAAGVAIGAASSTAGLTAPAAPGPTDPLQSFKQQVSEGLIARMGTRLFEADLAADQLRSLVVQEINDVMAATGAPLSAVERQRLVAEVVDDVIGLGPIQRFVIDPTVSEIMVNGLGPIFIERAGRLIETESHFVSEDHLRRVIDRIVTSVGRRVDESSPMVDARLADGSRVNAVLPPLSVDGPTLTIRKFSKNKLDLDDLVRAGAMTSPSAELLAAAVRGSLSILISGGTGSGKTTMLNALSGRIPDGERVITIEDAVELQLRQRHVVRLESRPANVESRGEITIRDLVRNALRMRPDRIIVGEVRGAEALDMLQAMNTGHEGSMSTVHANTPRESISRLETMVMMAGFELPLRAIREQIASGVDLIVQLNRFRDGSRRVTQVTEVMGMEGDVVTLSDLYLFDHSAGVDANGRALGRLQPTGVRPGFVERLAEQGIELSASTYAMPEDSLRRRSW
jgi:pilus assembly protein CpaF